MRYLLHDLEVLHAERVGDGPDVDCVQPGGKQSGGVTVFIIPVDL